MLRIALALLAPCTALAGQARILDARVSGDRSALTFEVTLEHADAGWDHYADRWRVTAPDGTVLGTRTLHHPHVGEQPFTRSLSGVAVPDGLATVRIEAHDSVHGWNPEAREVRLP